MATAEIALALPALVLITAIVLWGMTAVSTRLTCNDAARTGARAAARGESLAAVRELVVKALPEGATVKVTRDEAIVHVDVSVPVEPPAAANLPALVVQAHATAATEPGATGTDAAGPGATGSDAAGPCAAGPGATGSDAAGPCAAGPGACWVGCGRAGCVGPGAAGPGAAGSDTAGQNATGSDAAGVDAAGRVRR
ncbi:TadE family type IV pilus minor pilin [Actinomadura sp. CNU-125]|uniref:TadE family type IV pilus minor pilin n=1 Tax=Actinomadura sp. CNU-125 TaxID=1904961 RepID=UPI0009F89D96|nr:TadE family type IV pilus minor pilin [Actinomadura sp. CNU-125]